MKILKLLVSIAIAVGVRDEVIGGRNTVMRQLFSQWFSLRIISRHFLTGQSGQPDALRHCHQTGTGEICLPGSTQSSPLS